MDGTILDRVEKTGLKSWSECDRAHDKIVDQYENANEGIDLDFDYETEDEPGDPDYNPH